jgi:hypothetical protein
MDGLRPASRSICSQLIYPIVTLSLSDTDFGKLVDGKANAQRLFMSGKLKVKGDVMKATKMEVRSFPAIAVSLEMLPEASRISHFCFNHPVLTRSLAYFEESTSWHKGQAIGRYLWVVYSNV